MTATLKTIVRAIVAWGFPAAIVLVVAAGTVQANDFASNHPFGLGSNMNEPVNPSFRDANNNRAFVNGEDVTNGGTNSETVNRNGLDGGTQSASGGNAVSAVGNQLNVVTSGNYNTVIVNAEQNNYGNQEANLVLNGNVNLDQ